MHVLEASPAKMDLDQSCKEAEANPETDPLNAIDTQPPLKDVLANSIDCELKLDLDQEHDHFFKMRSALQHAIENGDPIIAQTLMDADVDLNNYEENGDGPRHRLPLDMKTPKGLIRITELLVKHVNRGRAKDAASSNSSATTLVNNRGEWRVALFLVTSLAT